MQGGTEVTSEEIIAEYKKNISFYSRGGITVTGGEPLMQTDFLIDLFEKAKAEGIHTCIDTSGITYSESNEAYIEKLDRLMQSTDLVMLDIKHIDPEHHKVLTSHTNEGILAFARYLEKKGIPLWVRHVVVEGYTDDPVYLHKLGRFIGELRNLKALDVLPYHTMGKAKYEELGIPYPLGGTEPTSQEKKNTAREQILRGIRDTRAIKNQS
jgi:pyruvate formate lyase activating enzyme